MIQATLKANERTVLETPRLILRALKSEDAPALAGLAGRKEIADKTLSIPHPYSLEQARAWIETQTGKADNEIVFVITLKETSGLIGTIGLRAIEKEHSHAEMGFWIGVESWGHGYATEAAGEMLGFGFTELGLNRIYAHHMVRNPASGRVLEKIGMKREGLLRQHVRKWGVFEDIVLLALLKQDWGVQKTG